MHYYLDSTGSVFAYDDAQVAAGLAVDKAPITPEEAEARISPPKTPRQVQEDANAAARTYLLETDWYIVRALDSGNPVPEEIVIDRQAARNRIIEI